jgi:hypothetical protein
MSMMKLLLPLVIALSVTFNAAICGTAVIAEESYGALPKRLKEHLDQVVRFYSDTVGRYDSEFLYLKNGKKYQIVDHRTDKSFNELLEHPDIDNMFYAEYPDGTIPKQPDKNIDPGRVRFEPLFVAMYGDCRQDGVRKNLRTIEWLPKHGGGNVKITKNNAVNIALESVSRDLDELPHDLIKYLLPTAGTYNCRPVAGANFMSMHAFGAAIDLNTQYANYWRWGLNQQSEPKWKNQVPIQIVRIFEKHGFIWGGYWYHYDTMHFEYRPEMFLSKEDGE